MRNNYKKKLDLPAAVIVQSLIVGFFAVTKSVNWGLAKGGFASEGVMASMYPPVIALIVITALWQQGRVFRKINISYLLLALYLILFYYYTQIFIGPPLTRFSLFIVFTIAAFLVPHFSCVDTRTMLKAMMFFPSFAILRIDQVFQTLSIWSSAISMDASYGFLVPIVANIVYLYFYFLSEGVWGKLFTIVLSIINLTFLSRIMLFGSRGVILSIGILLAFLYIVKKKDNRYELNKRRLVYVLIASFFLVTSFGTIVRGVDSYFGRYGISLHFIDKIQNLSAEGDITNGRQLLSTITWRGIVDSPLFGHGVDRFAENTRLGDVEYPHNFFLQLLYDGGVLLVIILFVPIVLNSVRYLKHCTKDGFAMFVALFFSSVPGALFSGDLWKLVILWMFFGLSGSSSFVYNRQKQF